MGAAQVTAQGQIQYDINHEIRLAYEAVTSLRFEEADVLLSELNQTYPRNHTVLLVANYRDFLELFIGEREEDYERLLVNRDKRLKTIERGNGEHPYYRYIQAEIRLQWAVVKLKFGNYVSAFHDVNRAFKLLKANQKKFPDFKLNMKSLGLLHAVVGTVPDELKWGLKLMSSLNGDLDQGLEEIEEALAYCRAENHLFLFEVETIHAFCQLHLSGNKEGALQSIEQSSLQPELNLLHAFIVANIAQNADRNDLVIQILESRPEGDQFYPFHYLEFLLGLAKTYRLENDAERHLIKFVTEFQGQHYIKEAYQKMAWNKLIRGDVKSYFSLMQECLHKGKSLIEEDEKAEKEAKAGVVPQVDLLKARLLFDGGYAAESLTLLSNFDPDDLKSEKDRIEYHYRRGRVYQKLGLYSEALASFQKTRSLGKNSRYYFICNAALQQGNIYEGMGRCKSAKESYEYCLKMQPDSYKKSMHQKAKAGLNRLKC